MLNKAQVDDDDIVAAVRSAFGVDVGSPTFLPLGNDSNSWVYRVETASGDAFFVKLKRGTPYLPSLTVPRYLKDSGISAVVAPHPTRTGDLWAPVGKYGLLLYPFVDARAGMDVGLSSAQWTELGRMLRAVHGATLPAEIVAGIEVERFDEPPWWREALDELLTGRFEVWRDDAPSRAILTCVDAQRDVIAAVAAKAEATRVRMAAMSRSPVLCHCDIHSANVLVEPAGRMFIVDWDQPAISPPERVLMFILGAATGGAHRFPVDDAAFLRGYGDIHVDPMAMAYYRSVWTIMDITDYAIRELGEHDFGIETREAAVDGLDDLFRPGYIVAAALASPVPD